MKAQLDSHLSVCVEPQIGEGRVERRFPDRTRCSEVVFACVDRLGARRDASLVAGETPAPRRLEDDAVDRWCADGQIGMGARTVRARAGADVRRLRAERETVGSRSAWG